MISFHLVFIVNSKYRYVRRNPADKLYLLTSSQLEQYGGSFGHLFEENAIDFVGDLSIISGKQRFKNAIVTGSYIWLPFLSLVIGVQIEAGTLLCTLKPLDNHVTHGYQYVCLFLNLLRCGNMNSFGGSRKIHQK